MTGKNNLAHTAKRTGITSKASAKQTAKQIYKAPAVKKDHKLAQVTGMVATTGQD